MANVLLHPQSRGWVKLRSADPKDKPLIQFNLLQTDDDRAAFLGLAGHMMKRLLIHHARPLYRRAEQVEISEDAEAADTKAESLQEVEDALAGLAAIDHRLRAVVEMKVFEGLTGDEIARQLGCSRGTVNNWWRFAQSWLQEEWAPGRRG